MNIKDIARLAGVSVSTVSKVMNRKDDSISQETREKVLKIAREYHYTPYASVMTPGAKTFLIGVLLRSDSSALLNGMLERARALGYGILAASSDSRPEEERKAISFFCKNRADAVLWEAVGPESLSCTEDLEKSGIPFLFFNCPLPGAVSLNYDSPGYEAARLLIEQGHREIACLLFPDERAAGFFEGYKKGLFEHHLPLKEDLIFHSITPSLLHRLTNHSVTAIVCSHISAARKLYERCLEIRCRIPDDFSLLSLGEDRKTEASGSNISSYPIPARTFGCHLLEQAVRLAERRQAETESSLRQTGEAPSFSPFMWTPEPDSLVTVSPPFSMRSKKLTVVGGSNMDVYLKVPHLPSSGCSVRTSLSSQYPGGKGFNEAVGAARLGHRISFITAVGNDAEADVLCETLCRYSIDTEGVLRNSSLPTGRAYIFVEPRGESMITILSGANEALSPEDLLANCHLFDHAAYALISTEIPIETAETACRLVKERGGITILKPASCGPLTKEFLAQTDILVPNKNELREICPEPGSMEEKARFLLQQGADTVIVTLGADGCFLCSREQERFFPASDFPAIDNTGAGDAFISALASYLLYGYTLENAIQIAGCAAGFSVTREGVVPALIDKNTLEAYLLKQRPKLLRPQQI